MSARLSAIRTRRRHRINIALCAVATAAVVWSILPLVAPSEASAQGTDSRCAEGEAIRVLFLLDTSGSLRTNDPDGRRETGTVDALEDLSQIVDDYRLRLQRHYPRWSVFAAIDTFSGFHDDPELSNPYNRLSGDWHDLADPAGRQALRQAASSALEEPGSWTDYRAALRGAIDRLAEPLPSGLPSCDQLFWFTDGDHDTVLSGVLTDEEQAVLDGMCRSGDLIDQLRQSGTNVTAIELRVQRDSSAQLRRLVAGGPDCVGLDGKVADIASVADLAAGIEETVFRLVDPDFPTDFLEPCDSSSSRCEYSFTLSDDIEWVKVYVDLAGVANPADLAMMLHGPDGAPVAPLAFGEDWTRISSSGMLGRRPTSNITVVWAHLAGQQVYGMDWGDDQTWTIVFSGEEAPRARAGIRKDERGRATVEQLQVSGDDLRGTITPAPGESESARVGLHLDDGRTIDLSEVDGRIRSGGRFTVPRIVDHVVRTAQGDSYLAANGCVGTVEVSLIKAIDYGGLSGLWTAPLRASTAGVPVPRALCGLSGQQVPTVRTIAHDPADRFDPEGALTITADGGILDGELRVVDVGIESAVGSSPVKILPGWATGWRCTVPADAVDHSCGEGFAFSAEADADSEIDIRLTLSSTSTDPLQVPPADQTITHVIRVPVEGRLPGPAHVAVDDSGPSAVLNVSADGGTVDGFLELAGITAAAPAGSSEEVPAIISGTGWTCRVPALETASSCPPIPVFSDSGEGDAVADVSVALRAVTDDPNRVSAVREIAFMFEGMTVASALPAVTEVAVEDRFDPSGSLRIVTQGGALASVVTLDTGPDGLLPVEQLDGPEPELRTEAQWLCDVPAGAVDHRCPDLAVDATVDGDSMVDLVVPLRVSSDPEREPVVTAARLERVEDVSVGVRERSEVLANLVRYLLIVALVVAVVRMASAWARRRWRRLSESAYYVVGGRLENGAVIGETPERFRCRALGANAARARLREANVTLRIPWWPLLLGGPVQIVAAAPGRSRVVASGQVGRGEGRFGHSARRLGGSLEAGWVIVEHGHQRYRLVLWDPPRDKESVGAAADTVWRAFERGRTGDSTSTAPESTSGAAAVAEGSPEQEIDGPAGVEEPSSAPPPRRRRRRRAGGSSAAAGTGGASSGGDAGTGGASSGGDADGSNDGVESSSTRPPRRRRRGPTRQ